ncbi:META domain-containing protein [Zunongwangia sp. F260]|uniref:META domain-containing protein n=1 Tax=Autumnicola lenta TaxID=3075593 RepID=A0ABU3CH21_9FLAO|nr:META domain-containing protein [Zunongwangia sp. F260]MDT0645648.1 META domain-containing protein [Zunongwangia sp. F260]
MKKVVIIISAFLMISCGNSEKEISEDPSALNAIDSKYKLLEIEGQDVSSEGFNLQFNGKEQRLSGKLGCNNFVATYKIQDSVIKFNPALGTKMYCEGLMEYEDKFGEVLPEIRNVKIEDNDLTLLSGDNEELLSLKKKMKSE